MKKLDYDLELFSNHMLSYAEEDSGLALKNFSRPYLFTNEHLDITIKRMKPYGKSVLTAGSSGDQAIYSILYGATDVAVFDLCPFAEHIFNYKRAMILNLTYEEMKEIVLKSNKMFAPSTYRKISHDVLGESKVFWDTAFIEGFDNTKYDICQRRDSRPEMCKYLQDKELYNKIREALNGTYTISFLNTHLQNLPNVLNENEKFDIIMLSNIVRYVHQWDRSKKLVDALKDFFEVVDQLSKHLNNNGIIQIDYRYSDLLKRYKEYANFYGKEKICSIGTSPLVGAIIYKPFATENINDVEQEEVFV